MSGECMSDVAASLVARGWAKVDPPPPGCGHPDLPDGPSWAYTTISSEERPGPQSVISLMLPGESFDCILGIASCECCERVAQVKFFDPDIAQPIAAISYWPGLDQSIGLCREIVSGFLDTLEEEEEG